jgi:hypothetical protein
MLFLLIFPVLVAGFFACHIHPYHAYKLHRYEGQYLYLKSAELGLRCFGLALILGCILSFLLPDKITIQCIDIDLRVLPHLVSLTSAMGANSETESLKMAWFFYLSFLTFVSAVLLKFLGHISLYLRFKKWDSKVVVMGEILCDSPLDNLLFTLSLQKDKYVMLTLTDRKVYVGKVISLGEPTETDGMDQDISIIPLMSGHRDKDTLKVEFDTHYSEIESDIYLSLRQDSILSATPFDFDAYKTWNSKGDIRW